jgi:hypothetical protein
MLLPDVTQSGSGSMTIFAQGTLVVGPDEITAVQTEGVPVLVHPESMLLPDVTQSGSGAMTIF